MKLELTDAEISKIEQFFNMLYGCDVEILILHTYDDDRRKGYINSQILDRDDVLDYASGKRKPAKNQIIERVLISNYVDPIFEMFDVAICDAKEAARLVA